MQTALENRLMCLGNNSLPLRTFNSRCVSPLHLLEWYGQRSLDDISDRDTDLYCDLKNDESAVHSIEGAWLVIAVGPGACAVHTS